MLKRRRLHILIVIALVSLGFGLRLCWALSIAPAQASDARMYTNVGLALAAGEGYQRDGEATAYYPIGYPVALAIADRLFGVDPVVARLANAVFAIGTLLGLYAVAYAITRSRVAATITLLSFAIYPADIGYTAITLSQPFFNTLAMLGCALCLTSSSPRSARLLTAGLLLGAAASTRHQGVVLLLLIAMAWLMQRRRRSYALWVSGAFALALVPWTVRNAIALHAFVPISTNGGINLYIGNNPRANGHYKFTHAIEAPLAALISGPRRAGHNEVLVDQVATRLAWQYATQRPQAALALWPRKLEHLYGEDDTFAGWSHRVPDDEQARRVQRAGAIDLPYYELLLKLAAVGCAIAALELCVQRTTLRSMIWLPAAVVAAFTGLHMLTFGDPTYHHPMMPWITIYVGYAIATPWRYRHALRSVLRKLVSVVRGVATPSKLLRQ